MSASRGILRARRGGGHEASRRRGWANAQDFTSAAVSEFFSVADYQLIAHAAAHGHTVVTHEQPQAGAKRRVLIPNVCLALGVDFCNTFTMLRSHSVQLDLRLTPAS